MRCGYECIVADRLVPRLIIARGQKFFAGVYRAILAYIYLFFDDAQSHIAAAITNRAPAFPAGNAGFIGAVAAIVAIQTAKRNIGHGGCLLCKCKELDLGIPSMLRFTLWLGYTYGDYYNIILRVGVCLCGLSHFMSLRGAQSATRQSPRKRKPKTSSYANSFMYSFIDWVFLNMWVILVCLYSYGIPSWFKKLLTCSGIPLWVCVFHLY
jgi:hypothetical protein